MSASGPAIVAPILGCAYAASQRVAVRLSKLFKNVPLLPSIKESPFLVLFLFLLLWLSILKKFSLASSRNDDPLLGRPTGSLFFCPVGLAPGVALRNPQGEAFRVKCRAKPTTGATVRRPSWWLASAPSGGAGHATDGWAAGAPSVFCTKSSPGGG